MNSSDLDVHVRKENGHEGTDNIKEAIRSVHPRGYTQYGSLRRAAGIPGHEYGSHRARVFKCPAKYFRLQPSLLISIGEHPSGYGDSHVLIGRGIIKEDTGRGSRSH